ncbi:MAG: MarR family transcriptional regulator [Clostridiales bacterium]|jgi:DNA-binding MarR family transcriptional regulator|nr:MarR family transcriptional regulator [Clostridiales bacterium]
MKTKKGEYASGLIKEISNLYTLRVRIEAENLGIKNAYRTLLTQLYVKDGGTQLDLAEKTGMKAPTVSITLRKMEKDGLVDRVVDEKDLRKTHVYLTDKGKKTTEDLKAAIDRINEGFVKGLSDEEKDKFTERLEYIKSFLK